ncbi:TPA: DUF7210 family protein [Pseudomonas aeruginosa]
MATVKVTITKKEPNHTHAGRPVAEGDEIEVSTDEAAFLLRHGLIAKYQGQPKTEKPEPEVSDK